MVIDATTFQLVRLNLSAYLQELLVSVMEE